MDRRKFDWKFYLSILLPILIFLSGIVKIGCLANRKLIILEEQHNLMWRHHLDEHIPKRR